MRLVDDDRVVAGRDVADLVDHERELLQRRDDDPGLLPRQRLGELAGVLVDLHDHAAGVLELVDRVLELAVEDHRSVITTTLSKTLRSSASWSVESRCAVQAIVFDLPDPAECWMRYE